jgi:hypothetical protein
MIRRVTAHRGPKGHRYGGPQKTALHTVCKTRKARSAHFLRLTDQAVVTTATLVYPEFGHLWRAIPERIA